jgi:hypothetical protein
LHVGGTTELELFELEFTMIVGVVDEWFVVVETTAVVCIVLDARLIPVDPLDDLPEPVDPPEDMPDPLGLDPPIEVSVDPLPMPGATQIPATQLSPELHVSLTQTHCTAPGVQSYLVPAAGPHATATSVGAPIKMALKTWRPDDLRPHPSKTKRIQNSLRPRPDRAA